MYTYMKPIPYPRIDPGMAKIEKVTLLADQVNAFMEQGISFAVAMKKVLLDRYNGTQKHLFQEVASHEGVRSALRRAKIARQNAKTRGQLMLCM